MGTEMGSSTASPTYNIDLRLPVYRQRLFESVARHPSGDEFNFKGMGDGVRACFESPVSARKYLDLIVPSGSQGLALARHIINMCVTPTALPSFKRLTPFFINLDDLSRDPRRYESDWHSLWCMTIQHYAHLFQTFDGCDLDGCLNIDTTLFVVFGNDYISNAKAGIEVYQKAQWVFIHEGNALLTDSRFRTFWME